MKDTLLKDTPTPMGKAGNCVTYRGHFAK